MSYSCLSPRLLLNLFDDDDRAVTFRPTIEFTIYSRVARSRTRVSPRFDIHHLPSSPSFSYFRSFLQFERNESKSGWRKPSNKKHDAATDTISVKNNQCPVAAHLWYIYTYIYMYVYPTLSSLWWVWKISSSESYFSLIIRIWKKRSWKIGMLVVSSKNIV